MAIAVTRAGWDRPEKMEIKPGPTSSEIEQAVTYVLTGILDLAKCRRGAYERKAGEYRGDRAQNCILKTSGTLPAVWVVPLRRLSPRFASEGDRPNR